MPDQPWVVEDPAVSLAAAGAFFICDAQGRLLLAGADNLANLVGPLAPGKDLPELLRILDRGAWDSLFNSTASHVGLASLRGRGSSVSSRQDSFRFRASDGSLRWLHLRYTVLSGSKDQRLVFARDETAQALNLERLARAQSQEAEASARLQAAVLINGSREPSDYLEYACSTIPSKLVDGDFLDVIRLAPDRLDIILGDVMGKGMEAAILGTVMKFGLFRSLATLLFGNSRLPSVRQLCRSAELNMTPHLFTQRSIATLAYGRFYEKAMVYEFVDCGHTSLIHFRKASGSCRLVKGADMPLGFVEEQDFKSFLLPYREGDVIIAYSDGLSECPGPRGTFFGEHKIMYITRTHARSSAREIADSLIRLGYDFSASGFTDDVSLICIKASGSLSTPASPPCPTEGVLNLVLRQGSSRSTNRLRAVVEKALLPVPCLDEEERAIIVLACHEALSNIIEHVLKGRGIRCLVEWRLHAGTFSIEFSYRGPDYDWSLKHPRLPAESFGERGYGQVIMDQAMDSIMLCKGFRDEKTLILVRKLKCWME